VTDQTVRYRTIVADPPWDYPEGLAVSGNAPHLQDRLRGAKRTGRKIIHLPYKSLSVAEISQLPVAEMADRDCRLFLWTTNKYLEAALGDVCVAWGFTFKQLLVWDKTPHFPPFCTSVAPNAAEFLIVAATGHPPRIGKWSTSVIRSRKPRPEHSRKPEVFLDLAETVSPGPYLELFARRQRLGWDTWGDQALNHVEMVS
jgi:N6-adenosine-specific RNA methylase IME4